MKLSIAATGASELTFWITSKVYDLEVKVNEVAQAVTRDRDISKSTVTVSDGAEIAMRVSNEKRACASCILLIEDNGDIRVKGNIKFDFDAWRGVTIVE